MFCIYCGNKIDDDCNFCPKCGNKIIRTTNVQPVMENNKLNMTQNKNTTINTTEDSEVSSAKAFGKFLLVLILIFGVIFGCYKLIVNNDSSGNIVDKVVERKITKSDYNITTSQGLTSYSITVTPVININTCTIECTVYDDDGRKVYINTITKTDLQKQKSYVYKFEFGVEVAFVADRVSYNVSGYCYG